jgi:uncharacterized protein (TIGR03435 family)
MVEVSGNFSKGAASEKNRAIMSNRNKFRLGLLRKVAVVSVRAITVLMPIVVALTNMPFVHAQPTAQAFEVASVKPAAIPVGREGGNRSRIEHTPNSLAMWNVTLSDCVQWAYGVAFFQVSAAHLGAESYDILAKAGASVPVSQLRMMLQDLLAKRFKLALHRETRMFPFYELVVAKGGPNLPAANAGASRPLVHAAESLPRIQNNSFLFSDASMTEFAQMLTQLRGIDLPVVDRTGITGTFDIVLRSAPSAVREADSAALFAIIQEQLGLKLAPAKAPMKIVVIDHAEKPSEN